MMKKKEEKISKIIKDGFHCSIMYMLQIWNKDDNKCLNKEDNKYLIFPPIKNQIFAVYFCEYD